VIRFDEISLHSGHVKYILVISEPEYGLVLDVLPDRGCEAIEVACSDMWDAYQTVSAEKLPCQAHSRPDSCHEKSNNTLIKARSVIQKDENEDMHEN
jgi:hypothetical protein